MKTKRAIRAALLLLPLSAVLSIVSCKKDNNDTTKTLAETYEGTYTAYDTVNNDVQPAYTFTMTQDFGYTNRVYWNNFGNYSNKLEGILTDSTLSLQVPLGYTITNFSCRRSGDTLYYIYYSLSNRTHGKAIKQ